MGKSMELNGLPPSLINKPQDTGGNCVFKKKKKTQNRKVESTFGRRVEIVLCPHVNSYTCVPAQAHTCVHTHTQTQTHAQSQSLLMGSCWIIELLKLLPMVPKRCHNLNISNKSSPSNEFLLSQVWCFIPVIPPLG